MPSLRLFATALLLGLGGCTTTSSQDTPVRSAGDRRIVAEAIDAEVTALMKANRVEGLGLALIRDAEIVYSKSYGLRDRERALPLERDTIMYGASLTKATFAYMVMQLVDEGRVDLDRPIHEYLPRPLPDYENYADLAGDPRWRRLTMRMLLSHSAGFANFRWITPTGYDEDGKLILHFDPGSRYAYSGEGMLLAQFVLETGLGLDVGAEMQRRIFDSFRMRRTSMTWRADFAANLAHGYQLDGARQEHYERERVRAAGSMDTTLADWARFLAGASWGEGLSPASFAAMTSRQIAIDSAAQFPTLAAGRTDAYAPVRLGYGLGWGVFETPQGPAFFKEGHDDGTANYALCIKPKRDCILLMSNSVRAEGIFKALVDALMGETNLPWQWEGYTPYDAAPAAIQ